MNRHVNKKLREVVYTLLLQEDHYYAGLSGSWESLGGRLESHLDGHGSSWTRLHPPLKVLEAKYGSKTVERDTTMQLMRDKGWTKVRGAGWTPVLIRMPRFLERETHLKHLQTRTVDAFDNLSRELSKIVLADPPAEGPVEDLDEDRSVP